MVELVFALDVGTRTVIGLVAEKKEEKLHIKSAVVEEHEQRSMLDGQIHDIPQVLRVVKKIKKKLEKKLGQKLEEVSVAAAGRALKTAHGQAKREMDFLNAVTNEELLALEMEAVQAAQQALLRSEKKPEDYYCVGYSVTHYMLDGSPIINPTSQHGESLEVEVIATFLPRIVIDSLDNVLKQANLKMASITLEPIAAIQVAIPPKMRQLNLALIDIGAGTSDIALTFGGTVSGYEMVPSAGDTITEEICQILLVDFPTGEAIKRQLSMEEEIVYEDVVGMQQKMKRETILENIEGTVIKLARKISEKILNINGGKPPQAVICIGGGSLTPGLTAKLAQELGLPENRVAVRGREVVPQVTGAKKTVSGPEAITPLGIALSSNSREKLCFSTVQVNNRSVRLLGKNKITVADALLAAGVKMRHIYGKPGKALSVEVNGNLTFLKGEPARPGKVFLEGEQVSLETPINPGASLKVISAQDGSDARGTVGDVVPEMKEKRIKFNQKEIVLYPECFINGKRVQADTVLEDNARIHYQGFETVESVLRFLNCSLKDRLHILLNGISAGLETKINDGDVLTVVSESINNNVTPKKMETLSIFFNEKKLELSPSPEKKPLILADVFNYVDFDPRNKLGRKRLLIEINGVEGAFTSPLKNGDKIKVEWK